MNRKKNYKKNAIFALKGSYCIPNEGVPNPKFAPKYDDICEKINLDANSDARFNYKYVRSFIL